MKFICTRSKWVCETTNGYELSQRSYGYVESVRSGLDCTLHWFCWSWRTWLGEGWDCDVGLYGALKTKLVLGLLQCILDGYISKHTLVSLNFHFQIALHQTSTKLNSAAKSRYWRYSSSPETRKSCRTDVARVTAVCLCWMWWQMPPGATPK
jgi:hypothetical protein